LELHATELCGENIFPPHNHMEKIFSRFIITSQKQAKNQHKWAAPLLFSVYLSTQRVYIARFQPNDVANWTSRSWDMARSTSWYYSAQKSIQNKQKTTETSRSLSNILFCWIHHANSDRVLLKIPPPEPPWRVTQLPVSWTIPM
jgi:hypothetical protein